MKVYIAGKVSGLDPQTAEAKFENTEKALQLLGFEAVNPLRLVKNSAADWTSAMKMCIAGMMTADAVYIMPDYVYSSGATIERSIALNIGMPLFYTLKDLEDFHTAQIQKYEVHSNS